MKFYLDENLPADLARALDLINRYDEDETSVHALIDVFERSTEDEEWIPKLGKDGAVVITQDFNIHQTRQQRDLYLSEGLGVFFLKSPNKKKSYTYWEMVEELIKKWREIKALSFESQRPFAYRITRRSIAKLD